MKKSYLIIILLINWYGSGNAQTYVTAPLNQPNTSGEFYNENSITLSNGFSSGSNFHAYINTAKICAPLALTPSADQNYILTNTIRIPGITDASQILSAGRTTCEVNQTIEYFDGFGRTIQTIIHKGSPTSRDIVQPVAYDNLGRQTKNYLSYTSALINSNGSFRTNAITEQSSFYSNPVNGWNAPGVAANLSPFSESRFESSSLDRVLEQGASGLDWSLSAGHTIKVDFASSSNVYPYGVIIDNDGMRTLADLTGILIYDLYVTVLKDENWKVADGKAGITEEYKDNAGNVILKKAYKSDTEVLCTYYVYDDFGNLCFVLPPGADPQNGNITEGKLDKFCYQYQYDERQRLVAKKIPGKDWEYMVYNTLDQVVLTQDANQRAQSNWLFTKYDGLGRIIATGIYNNGGDRAAQQSAANNQVVLWEETSGGNNTDHLGILTGYTNTAFPTLNLTFLNITYYDDYTFPYYASSPNLHAQGTVSNLTKGLTTANRVYITDGSASYMNIHFYDLEGRLKETISQNHLGGFDKVINSYNFIGELLSSTRTHTSTISSVMITNRFEYDHMGRRKQSFQKTGVANSPEVLLSELDYNETGQIKEKRLGNNLQNILYTYNTRGWLKTQNSPLFNIEFKYDDAINGANPQYNGNISNQQWTNGGGLNTFSYSYDKLNRLNSGVAAGMSETVTYNTMGNITSMLRNGSEGTYNYDGNRLVQITNGALATNVYTYDVNGNAVTDGRNNKTITYNLLNLPATVSGGVSYTYDAAGNKLKKVSSSTIDYIKGIQYINGAIEFVQTEEGLARRNGNIYSYEYNLKDQLGNTRVSFYKNPVNSNLEVLQRDDYFAFGLQNIVTPNTNKYLYNGKELQDDLGDYDYGARLYDPVIGRWNVIDPLAESYNCFSPYTYVLNNPAGLIDPDGMRVSSPRIERPDGYKGRMGRGDWYTSDRINNTKRWQSANKYNLKNTLYNEYQNPDQRTAFYKWYQTATESQGQETMWAAAAGIISGQMAQTQSAPGSLFVSDAVQSFAATGNKVIFNDVFPRLRDLYNNGEKGNVLKGAAAVKWDERTLYREQFDVIDPYYRMQSISTINELSSLAKGEGIASAGFIFTPELKFKGNIRNPQHRYNYGMKVVVPFYQTWKFSGGPTIKLPAQ